LGTTPDNCVAVNCFKTFKNLSCARLLKVVKS